MESILSDSLVIRSRSLSSQETACAGMLGEFGQGTTVCVEARMHSVCIVKVVASVKDEGFFCLTISMTCGSVIQVRNCVRAICSWALESKSGYALIANQLKASAYSIQLSEVLLWRVLKSARYS